jgi:regulation of enolase protein 1 (concanavalin A-like superfamily)
MKKLNTLFIVRIFFFSYMVLSFNIYAQVIQSDDFNSPTLNTSIWTFINPLNDGAYTMTGSGTGNASCDISVPLGTDHDAWDTGVSIPRIVQSAADTDFEIEVKFESTLSVNIQQQGIIIEEQAGHLIRYEVYSYNGTVTVFGAIINNPANLPASSFMSKNIGAATQPYYLRVTRVGDDWEFYYSTDGNTWINAYTSSSYNYAMNVSSVGVYAGNSASTAHTAVVDYFFNTANPIVPEDSNLPKITINPSLQTVYNNSSISLEVKIEGITGLFASSITLELDETMFEYSNVSPGSFLESNANGYDVLYQSLPAGNTLTDFVTVDEAILGRDSADGTGTLFNIDLIPLRAGTGKIVIQSFELRNKDNQTINANIDSAEITIISPAPNTKIFLEGPYQTGAMTSLLPELGYLPLTQPFNTAPWNYTGFEKVDVSFYTAHPEIVDWVLVELRTGTAENTTVAKRAAFLNEAGNLVDIDGVNPVSFFVNSAIQYYIVIRHRNHLDVMSSSLVDVNYASTFYDFTLASTNAYGTDALKEVDTGVFAMYTGDANNDGIISSTDFNIYNPLFKSVATGYFTADWNLDGSVTSTDFNYFNPNFKAVLSSQVP